MKPQKGDGMNSTCQHLLISLLVCPCVYTHYRETRIDPIKAEASALLIEECNADDYQICSRLLNYEHMSHDDMRAAIETMSDIVERRHTELSDNTLAKLMEWLESYAARLREADASGDAIEDLDADTKDTRTTTRSLSTPVSGTKVQIGSGNIDGADVIGANALQNDTGLRLDYSQGSTSNQTFNINKNGSAIITIDDSVPHVKIQDRQLDLGSNDITNVGNFSVSSLSVDSVSDDGSGHVTFNSPVEVGNNAIQSTSTDSTLTITQDSNSSDGTAEDLTIETVDSSANNAVGNIVLAADSNNASAADIVLKTSTTERARIDSNGLNVDNLTDNGSGQISIGNTLDLNGNRLTDATGDVRLGSAIDLYGNTLKDSSRSDITLGSTLDVNSNNINNVSTVNNTGANLTLDTTSSGNVNLSAADNVTVTSGEFDIQTGTVNNSTGSLTITTNSGDLSLNPASEIDASSNNIKNVGNLGIDTLSTDSISDNGSGQITLNSPVEVGSNAIQSTAQDSTLTITQDSNSSDGTAENLTIKTVDSSANDAVGDIILSADDAGVSTNSVIFKTANAERARITANGVVTDNIIDNGSGTITFGNTVDLDGNNLTDGTGDITLNSAIDLNGNNLKDSSGSDITLGTALNANSNDINNASTVNNDSANLTLETTTSGDISLSPVGSINVNSNTITNASTIDGGTGSSVTIQTATASDSANDTKSITIDAQESETGDAANIDLNIGANNGNLIATNLKTGSGTALVIDSNGNILEDSSSKRFKRDIQSCEDDIADRVLNLEPVSFYRNNQENSRKEYGLIAEQVEEHVPELVTYGSDGQPRGLMYNRVAPLMITSMRKQQDTIHELEATVEEQHEQINELYMQYASLQHEVQQLRELMTQMTRN